MVFEEYEDHFAIKITDRPIESDIESIELCFSRADVSTLAWFFRTLEVQLQHREKNTSSRES